MQNRASELDHDRVKDITKYSRMVIDSCNKELTDKKISQLKDWIPSFSMNDVYQVDYDKNNLIEYIEFRE
jgi:hypothetical protein